MSGEIPERAQWDSGIQFILTCIGYAVGLGNIWRFPSLAYEHGGGAFLIPYLSCSFLVGFPLLYLEMSLGQFSRSGPAVLYGRIRPVYQGIGWCMAGISLMVAIYYNVIVAWTMVYLYVLVMGRSKEWSSCRNEFNTIYCQSSLEDQRCADENGATNATDWAFFFNGTCHYGAEDGIRDIRDKLYETVLPAVSPAEEFFERYVLEKTPTMDSFGGFNFKVVVALAIAWILTALVLLKGVKMMGKIAPYSATIPYVIIVMLFIRGVTLDGAKIGMDYYILKPNMTVIYDPETWRAAATHVCYSLAIAFGGLMSLSSFNPIKHNCFKDALIITVADAVMSMFGGTAVFSVLGFMSKQLEAPIETVVQSGTGLAFIAYPEAMSRMPLPWLWSALFFIMLFILGITSQFGLAEVMITAIYDQFPKIRVYKAWIAVGVCTTLFFAGLCMCTRAGIFYFNIFNDYTASFSIMFLVLMELYLIVHVYGLANYMKDLHYMMGEPKSWLGRWFGPTGRYVQMVWKYVAPIESAAIFVVVLMTQIGNKLYYGKGKRLYEYPNWAIMFGWTLSLLPLMSLPAFVLYNLHKFSKQGRSWRELFRLQPKWTSYERNMKEQQKKPQNGVNGTTQVNVVPLGDELKPQQAWVEPNLQQEPAENGNGGVENGNLDTNRQRIENIDLDEERK
ncbi:unnamed protein product [Bursaphelenchus xylophilus]|nr:unnamed protein product [Bursaphelenchus xylophilus]CAG9089135.1 unnamed protein product [Bursaphelenchus xylophilus]